MIQVFYFLVLGRQQASESLAYANDTRSQYAWLLHCKNQVQVEIHSLCRHHCAAIPGGDGEQTNAAFWTSPDFAFLRAAKSFEVLITLAEE